MQANSSHNHESQALKSIKIPHSLNRGIQENSVLYKYIMKSCSVTF